MGQQQAIYAGYLARWHADHPNVVRPDTISLKALGPVERIGRLGRYHTSGSCEVYRAADGRIAEMCCTTSGHWRDDAVAVFPSEAAWKAFEQPQPMTAYLGHW